MGLDVERVAAFLHDEYGCRSTCRGGRLANDGDPAHVAAYLGQAERLITATQVGIDPDRLAWALGRITQDTPGALAMADQENTYPALALVAAAIAKAYQEDVLPEIEEPEVPSGGPD